MSPDRGLQDPRFYHSAVLLRDLEGPVDRGGQIVTAKDNDCHGITSRFCRRSCGAGVCSPFACKSGGMKRFLFHICILMFLFNFFIFPYFSFSSQDLPPEGPRLRRAESLPATIAVLSGGASFRSVAGGIRHDIVLLRRAIQKRLRVKACLFCNI